MSGVSRGGIEGALRPTNTEQQSKSKIEPGWGGRGRGM